MKDWIEIAGLEDIPQCQARVVRTGTHKLAVFRTASDEVFAVEDACPHRQGLLSQGVVRDNSVTCPCHNWTIDLTTGNVMEPDKGSTLTFRTRVKSGRIFLSL